VLSGEAEVGNQPGYGLRLIGFKLAKKEFLEGHLAKFKQSALRLGE
jgi:hypothetical protein